MAVRCENKSAMKCAKTNEKEITTMYKYLSFTKFPRGIKFRIGAKSRSPKSNKKFMLPLTWRELLKPTNNVTKKKVTTEANSTQIVFICENGGYIIDKLSGYRKDFK